MALLTRDQFEELGYWRGQTVWVQPQRERVLPGRRSATFRVPTRGTVAL